MNIVSIVAKTNTGELFDVPVSDLSKYTGTLSIGDGYLPKMSAGKFIASSVIEDKNGQLFFKNYKNDKSYIGTPVALLGYDINGGIVPVPLINKPQPSSVATTSQSFVFNGTPLTIPIFSSDGSSLEDSDFKKFANGNYSLGGTNPFFKFDVDSGSINISQQTSNDAFRINNKIVITVDQSNDEITIGNIIYHTTNIQHIKTDSVQFNTSATGVTGGVGVLTWNDTDGTLEFGMKGGNVTQQIGQELPVLVKHADNSGLTNGSAVYIVGSDGNNKTVRLAKADLEATSSNTFGIMTESATGGNKAFCTTFGLVRDINTSSLTEGSAVYLSPSVAGGITSTKPTAPNHIVLIGFCVRSHSVNGSIFVNVNNGYELDELHDVLIGTKVNKDLLSYESASGLWKNKTFADLGLATVDAFWSISGNNLATTGIIGSTSAQDVEFKANNQARFTMYAGAGLVMHSDATFEDIVTMESAVNMSALTASQILALDASKNIQSLSTVTYPNLTELSYVKGLTSTAQTQINSKEPTITAGTTSQYWRGDKSWQTLNKAAVGLGNVDNTTDLLKPISTATQAALVLKANLDSPTFTGTVILPSTTSIGTVSSTEIGYLDGVTSSIQTQISGKFSTPIGLTTNYVTKWNGTALVNSSIFDNGNVGIGTTNPVNVKLHVAGGGIALDSNQYLSFGSNNLTYNTIKRDSTNGGVLITANTYNYLFKDNGRLLINKLADNGFATLQVQGNILSSFLTANTLLKADANKVIVSAVDGTDFISPSWLTNNYWVKSGSNLYYNAGNVGIGTTNPSVKLDVNGQVSVSLGSASVPAYSFFGDLNNGWFSPSADTQAWSVGGSEVMRLNSAGSLGIGTTSLTGVNLRIAKSIAGGGGGWVCGVLSDGQIQSDVTTTARYFQSTASTAASVTIGQIRHFQANQGTFGAGSSASLQIAFYADPTLIGAISNYGFYGDISAATNRWNTYNAGTAQNYFRGNVGIGSGSTVPATELEVRGVISASLGSTSSPAYTFVGDTNNGWYSPAADTQGWVLNASEVMRLNSTGLGIGVTPAYKLDVNGTGHFTGAVTFDTVPSSLVDATTSNHLVRYSQWIASTSVKYLPMAVSTVALTNITLSGTQTVNGVALIANDRILVTGQATTTDNGVWVVAAGSWTRATDSDIDSEIRGFIVSISGGTYAGYKYINTNSSAITIGTTPITYSEFSNVSEIDPVFVAWRDLSRTANTVLAAPNGSAGAASFRSLVTTDISNLSSYSSLSNYTTTSSLTTLLSGKSDIGHTHTFASLTSTPTTISGYGITILVSDVPTLNQNTTGSAATLTTTRNIATTGDLAWNVNFNGSADVTAVATLATVNSNIGTFNNLTVNAKGLVTSASLISYLTGNETITLSGDIVGSGTTAITTTLSATGVSAGTYQSITVDTKGRVTAGTNPTTLSGYGITDVYTKTESNARYVDLYNNQTNIAGQKTFTDLIYIRSLKISELESYSGEGFSGPIYVTTNGLTSTDKPLELFSSVTYFSNDSNMPHAVITDSGLKIGGLSDYSILPSERLDVDGNIIYTGLLMANSSAGANGQFLGTNGSVDSWTTLTTNHISNLSSYSDFDNYFTETEITDFLDTKQNLLSGTGIVLSTAGTISYLTNNSTNWNSAYTFTNGFATNYPDLVAIEALAGTSGLLKKTAANTWALDSTSYLSTVNLTTDVTGILPIINGGTGSSLQNFVDLTTDQSISGIKTFNSQLNLGSILNLTQTLYSNFNNTSAGYRFNTTATGGNPYSFRINGTSKLFIHNNGVAIGYADNTSSSDRLDVNGTIKYVNLKADNSLGTSGQFLKSQGGSNPNAWSNIQMTDITGLSSALVSTLAGLTDVQLSSLGNKNILSYDTSLSKWKNSTPDSVDIIDKSTNQTITGLKIFTGGFRYLSPVSQSIATSYNTWNSTDIPLLTSSIGGYGESINGLGMYFNKYIFKGGYLKLGGSYGIAGISSSVANPTERLDIDGNVKYSGLMKPSGVSGTNKQVLSTNGTIDGWVTLDTSYISNLASYSGLENYTTTNDLTLILNDLIPTGTSGHFLTRDSEGELVFMDINIDPVTLSANKIAVGSPQGLLTEVDNFEFLSKRTLSISRAGYQDQKINIGHSLNSPHALIEVLGGRLELNSNVGIKINNLSGAGNRMLFVDAAGNVGATAIPSGGSGGTVNYLPVNQIAFGSNTNEVTSTQNLTYEVASGQNRLKITNNSTNLFISTADNENSSISSNHSITISSTFKDVELLAGYYDAKVILSGNAVRLLTGAGGLWHNNTELEWVTTTINGQSRQILLKKL